MQGEICFRGRHIMMGYMANPDFGEAHIKDITEKNRGTIDTEATFHHQPCCMHVLAETPWSPILESLCHPMLCALSV
eukprot:5144046-Amphidinium_carterae.1